MNELLVVPIGEVEERWLNATEVCARDVMMMQTRVTSRLPLPPAALDSRRNQYLATAVMESLLPLARQADTRVLGVTEADLFIPMLTFLFGQAQLDGRLALVSVARLTPRFYGLPPHAELTEQRLRKEIVHELGHTLGLVHCDNARCAMSLSNTVLQVDAKSDAYCAPCGESVRRRLREYKSGGRA